MVNLLKLELSSQYSRPVIVVNDHIYCLIDTGANTPVWTYGADTLIEEFDAVEITGIKFVLSGFGKIAEETPVFQIPKLVLGDINGEYIEFHGMYIACTLRPTMVTPLILSATMFTHMNYMIRNLAVKGPTLEIEHEKNDYYVRPVYNELDNKYMQRIYSFAE